MKAFGGKAKTKQQLKLQTEVSITLTRMRTINKAIAAIKDEDPHTAFTPTALLRMIKSGELPSITVGTKYLVCLDTVLDYLRNPTPKQTEHKQSGVRPIPERLNGEYHQIRI